jgi:hypothetical protein
MPDADKAKALRPLPLGGYTAILAECRTLRVPDTCRRVLDDCLGYLNGQLQDPATGKARRAARQTLRELADLIASGQLGLACGDYQRILGRLAAIFTIEAATAAGSVLVSTAPSYAGVVAAISRACPSCDYEAPLGQMLTYMARLFLDRRSGWKSIYRNILAISDGVAAKRRLDDAEFARIQEWIESGATNLFPIQRDLVRAIHRLGQELAGLDAAIAQKAASLDLSLRRWRADPTLRNVVSLAARREVREIAELERRRRDVRDRIQAKQGVKDLVDADIQDLDESLRAARRAYFIRLAWSTS